MDYDGLFLLYSRISSGWGVHTTSAALCLSDDHFVGLS